MTWIQTRSGKRVNLVDPDPDSIEILDIAHALSMQCRWNGHCSMFYSVAQHSVLCSMYTSAEFALAALMHDAAEAYIGDIVTPLKRILFKDSTSLEGIEDTLMEVIAEKFDFQFPFADEVIQVDADFLQTEWWKLMNNGDEKLPLLPSRGRRYTTSFMSWSPIVAHRMFLDRFNRLSSTLPIPIPTKSSQEALFNERLPLLTYEERCMLDLAPLPRMEEL